MSNVRGVSIEVVTVISPVCNQSSSVEGTPNVEGLLNIEQLLNIEEACQTCTTEDSNVYVEVCGEHCRCCTKRNFLCLRWDRGEKLSKSCWRCGVYGDKQVCLFVRGKVEQRLC
jgi:hypothetical protein